MTRRSTGKPGSRRRSRITSIADTRRVRSATDDSAIAPERLLALFGAKDLDVLIGAVFLALHAAVACDFASAFYRSTGDGLFKQRDSLGREYGPALMRRYMELTPALPIAMANRGIKILPTRTGLPRSAAKLKGTAFYREIMQPQGWRHAVALCFWGDPPAESPVFVASVYRSEEQNDFSERDIANLERIQPFIDCAVNRLHEREAATTVRDGMAMAAHDGTRGFAILDGNLRLVQANPTARQFCAAWMDDVATTDTDGSSVAWRLPPALEAKCRELHSEWRALGTRRSRRGPSPPTPPAITCSCSRPDGIDHDRLSKYHRLVRADVRHRD